MKISLEVCRTCKAKLRKKLCLACWIREKKKHLIKLLNRLYVSLHKQTSAICLICPFIWSTLQWSLDNVKFKTIAWNFGFLENLKIYTSSVYKNILKVKNVQIQFYDFYSFLQTILPTLNIVKCILPDINFPLFTYFNWG